MSDNIENTNTENLKIPNHIAVVCDGNRRWAKEKGLPTFQGHFEGFQAARKLVRKAHEMGVHTVTLWVFSTENWNRSKEEVDYLMNLYIRHFDETLKEALENKTRVYHLGRKDRIPVKLKNKILDAEEKTKGFTKNVINIALDYGGHDDILRAIQKAIKDVLAGKIKPEELSEEVGKFNGKYSMPLFKNYLDTKDQPYPYPDLIIRTGGEQRLSGFLSWQLAYSEMYFPEVYLPAFTPEELIKAIEDFSGRDRRYGGNSQQSPGDYTNK